jgi:ribosomal protein S18 acetylase RimI-like enzyme
VSVDDDVVEHPLDNPAWYALTGPQAWIAERKGDAARFPADVGPFGGLPTEPDAQTWTDFAALAGPGGIQVLTGPSIEAGVGWRIDRSMPGVQMDGSGLDVAPDPEAVVLGAADVPEMLDLVARTQPGPFGPRTCELGVYLGIRHEGALVAMAGERMRPPGWSEISGVCTDPAHRGRGLAARLVRAVGHAIRDRGDVPFLHASATNTNAIRLYETLGFTLRRKTHFSGLLAP